MGALLRFAKPYIMKSAGMPEGMPSVEGVEAPKFASEESDLMATVFKSALRLFSGSAKREELASELSDKLYAGRGRLATMSELGIELEKPGAKPSDPAGTDETRGYLVRVHFAAERVTTNPQPDTKSPAKPGADSRSRPRKRPRTPRATLSLAGSSEKAKANPELTLIPIVLVGMLVVRSLPAAAITGR